MKAEGYQNRVIPSDAPWSVRMTESVMRRDPILPVKWAYDYGVIWKGMEMVWRKTGEKAYFDYIKTNMDIYVDSDGNIGHYRLQEYNIDHINNGKLLFPLYKETKAEKYKKAAYLLRHQLLHHPRTTEGGFWHKFIYPHQMWLDGIYMGSPFYAEFAKTFNEPEAFDDVAKQIILMDKHARDHKTGLLYHGWDESRGMKWSDDKTGCSPNFWGRAMGWYAVAIVDVLDYFPEDHAKRGQIIEILSSMIAALAKVQDRETGLWYQVVDQGGREGNYLEASASCMYIYSIAKAVGKGYIDEKNIEMAKKAYAGVLEKFIEVDDQGLVNLHGTCSVAGLGGNPYRNGSFEYYISEPVVKNDPKGVGAFILAAAEIEKHL